jgi:rubrerythrin
MDKTKAMEILKGAILLEMKGKAFYEHNARQATNAPIKKVFETMSMEEESHVEILSRQMKSLGKSGQFEPMKHAAKGEDFAEAVISREIRGKVAAAGYEAAAISAAMAMEERAVQFYSDRAAVTTDPLEKEIYQWLADWEKTHLHLLTALDRELMESVWHDNQFWPVI